MKQLRILVILLGIILSTGIYAGDEETNGNAPAANAQDVQTITGTIIKKEVTRKGKKYTLYYIQTEDKKKIALAKKVAEKAKLNLEEIAGKKYSLEAKVQTKKGKKGSYTQIVEIVNATPAEQAEGAAPQPAE